MCIFRKPRLKIRLMRTGVCRPHHCTPLVQKSSASKIQLRNNAKNLEWVHFILWLTTRAKFLQFYPSTVDKQKKKFFPVATTHLSRESCRYKASPIILLFVNLTTTKKKIKLHTGFTSGAFFFSRSEPEPAEKLPKF